MGSQKDPTGDPGEAGDTGLGCFLCRIAGVAEQEAAGRSAELARVYNEALEQLQVTGADRRELQVMQALTSNSTASPGRRFLRAPPLRPTPPARAMLFPLQQRLAAAR